MASHLYVRVSTKSQDHRSQVPDLKRWEETNGKSRWHRDTFTGKTMDRPAMSRLMHDLQAAKLARIVVWRL